MKKISYRTCVVSKEKLEQKNLIRVVRTPDKKVVIDTTYKLNGRGAYLKKDIEVINKAIKSKILEKKLEVLIDKDIYEELKTLV